MSSEMSKMTTSVKYGKKCEISSDNSSSAYYGMSSETFDNEGNFGIGFELFKYMRKFERNIAQLNYETNTIDTYGTQLRKCIRTALKLKSKNLTNDAIIGVCAKNHSNSSVPFIAALFLDYRTLTFDGSISSRDATFLIKQVTPTILFVDEEFAPMMKVALENSGENVRMVIFGKYENYSSFDEYLEISVEEEAFEPIKIMDPKKTASIMLSSGSTGLSKGICLSHEGFFKQIYNQIHMQNISSNSILYYFTTLNWISSVILLMTATFSGAARVNNAVANAWQAIDKYKVTNLNMSPFIASVLVGQDKPEGIKTESVKVLITQGTKLNPLLRSKLQSNFPEAQITQSYGITEASGWITMFKYGTNEDRIFAQKKPESVGKIVLGMSYKIVDRESNQELGPNKVGELRLKYDYVMNGYFNQDASQEFDSEGWFKTGDLMYYDEDECFYVVGRCKELLKYRGFHIQPQMLELILESHPAVKKAVVLGITHEIDGDHAIGIVTLNEGYGDTLPRALEQYVDPAQLELYVERRVQERQRLRKGVRIIEDMPYTATGKPKRFLLKKWLEEGRI